MDARIFRAVIMTALALVASATHAGSYRTKNFIVTAPTAGMAEQIGKAAERYRRELAIDWLGKEMPAWAEPCPITAEVAAHLGAGGATSFLFERGEVYGWQMTIQGSLERILDSVLPHEVTHTIFASHFRQPLPRWADEGACTTVEHVSERNKQQLMLVDFLRTGRGIPFSKMFAMREYPADVMPLYSQGYSLARYLIAQGGKQKFLAFVKDGLQDSNWPRAVEQNYAFTDLGHLQNSWLDWVRQGSPNIEIAQPSDETPVVLASTATARNVNGAVPKRRTRTADGWTASPAVGRGNLQERAASSVTDAYPNDDDLRMVPIQQEKLARSDRSQLPTPTTRTAGWQRKKDAFVVPDDSVTPDPAEDSYTRDDQLPGPSTMESASHQVTRPQPTQQARQIILEWSRP